jgi:hypothetical protein
MIRLNLILFGLLFSLSIAGQKWELQKALHLPEADLLGVDQFGSIYTANGYELRKFDADGKERYAYANPVLGDIYEIDVLNPLAPYLFFRDANQMVVIDNRLNQKGQLNFNDFHFIDVQLISFSDQDNVWFYDQGSDKLYRFNIRSQKSTNESLTITQIVGKENRPVDMVSSIDKVYLNIPDQGIYIFDATGAFVGILPLLGVEIFDVEGKQLVAVKDAAVIFYNLRSGTSTSWSPEIDGIRDIRLFNSTLYLFDGDDLKVYQAIENE